MAVVTTNKKLSEITYTANEAITVNPGVTLTIDASNSIYPKSITATSGGAIELINQSSTQIICFTLYGANSATYRLDVSTGATLRARGKMLTVHTGTGAANQIIDFTVGELAKVPYPSLVMIEHSAGSGDNPNYADNNGSQYVVYPIVCTAGKPKVFAPTDVSNGECGRVLFWDATTRKLSCGDGVRGNVIQAGCKVLIPNIYIHGGGTIADNYAARAQAVYNNGGHADLECVAFSDAISGYNTAVHGKINYKNVGYVGSLYHITQYPMSVQYLIRNPCPNWQNTLPPAAMQLYCYNKATIKDVVAVTSRSIYSLTLPATASGLGAGFEGWAGSTINNVLGGILGNRDANHLAVWINRFSDSTVKNVTAINGLLRFNSLNQNIIANDFKHAGSYNGIQSPIATGGVYFAGTCNNVTLTSLKLVGAPIRSGYLVNVEIGAKNINVFLDQNDYPLNTASAASIISSAGENCEFDIANATASTTGATPNIISSQYAINNTLRLKGTASSIAKITPSSGATYNGVSGLPENVVTQFVGIQNYCAMYLLALSNTPNSGWICFSTFGAGEKVVLSGGAQADSGELWLRTVGAQMTAESPAFHGITAFLGSVIKYSYVENGVTYTNSTTPPLNMSIKFAVARSTGAFTVDEALTQSNLAAALLSLNEYDRYDGVRIRLTVTATANDPTLALNKVFWDVSHDVNYVRPDVSLFIRGTEAGETIDICLYSDDSVIKTFTSGAAQQFAGGANLGKSVYFNRKKDGVLICSTKYMPITLRRGNMGNIDLFAGSSVQLADAAAINDVLERDYTRIDAIFNRSALLEQINDIIKSIDGNVSTML